MQWGTMEAFTNKMVYLLETLVWQNGYDPKKKAQHKANKPKLFVPPFMQKPGIDADKVVHDIDDIKGILARPRSEAEA